MGNFLSQFTELINKDGDSKVPDVQLDFEGMHRFGSSWCGGSRCVEQKVDTKQISALSPTCRTFLDASLTGEDAEVYSTLAHLLDTTADLLELLRTYEGCGQYIRQVRFGDD